MSVTYITRNAFSWWLKRQLQDKTYSQACCDCFHLTKVNVLAQWLDKMVIVGMASINTAGTGIFVLSFLVSNVWPSLFSITKTEGAFTREYISKLALTSKFIDFAFESCELLILVFIKHSTKWSVKCKFPLNFDFLRIFRSWKFSDGAGKPWVCTTLNNATPRGEKPWVCTHYITLLWEAKNSEFAQH